MIAISVNVNARQLTITMKLFCAIAVWPRPHSSAKTALPISMNLDRDFLTIAVNLDGDCLTICTCNCAYTIFHNDLDTTLQILCNSLSTLSMTFIAFSDINQVAIVYCDQFDVGMVYLSLWKLFRSLEL